jgi:hypothetical protein
MAAWAVSIEVRVERGNALAKSFDAVPDAWDRQELGLLQGLRHG